MSCAQPGSARDDLDTIIAALVTDQQARRLPPRYPPLIGMITSPSILAKEQWRVMSADITSIEAVLAFGGEVRLLPLRLPHTDEDAIEMVLRAVLPFDGLLFSGSSGDTDSRLYSQVPYPRTAGPEPVLDRWAMLMA